MLNTSHDGRAEPVDVSLLLPTRGRPEKVRRLFESIKQTTAVPARLEVVLCLDNDDETARAIEDGGLSVVRLIGSPRRAMGAMFASCYEASRGRYLMLLNDDVVFHTKQWDATVRACFERFPDGIALVYGNDLDQGRHVPTFPFLSRRACEVMGQLCPPEYLNLHIESHLFDIFKRLAKLGHDRVVYLDRTIFEHLNPAVGKSQHDATSVKRDPFRDVQLYFELEDSRQALASDLAREIETPSGFPGRERMTTIPRMLPGASGAVSVSVLAGLDSAAPERLPATVDELLSRVQWRPCEFIFLAASGMPLPVSLLKIEGVGCCQGGTGTSGSSVVRSFNDLVVQAHGDYIAYLPAGAKPDARWLAEALGTACSEPAAVVGAKVLHPRCGRVLHAGTGFFMDSGQLRFTHLYRGVSAAHVAVNRSRTVQAVTMTGCVVARRAFIEAKGFDESLESPLLAWLDLCLRIGEHGGRVVYAPRAIVHHDDGEDLAVALARAAASGWRPRARADLGDLLAEDGFSLICDGPGRYSVHETGR